MQAQQTQQITPETAIDSRGYIQTFSGTWINPLDPHVEEINIFDIAHALSSQCRFSGHTRVPYSVAEHCIRVSLLVPPEHGLEGLLHDASEAYLMDMPRPVKHGLGELARFFREAEARLMEVICKRFELRYPLHTSVKKADKALMATEQLLFMPETTERRFCDDVRPLRGYHFTPCSHTEAEHWFMDRYFHLTRFGATA